MEIHQEKLKPASIGKKIKSTLFASAFLFLAMSLYLLFGSFRKKEPTLFIPILFTETGIPLIEVTIEENRYPFELDLGGDFYFSIANEVMSSIKNKKSNGAIKSCDVKGNLYDSPITSVDLIEINKIKVSNVSVIEEKEAFILEGSVLNLPLVEKTKTDRLQILGRVGTRFFKGIDCWLIDFPNASLVAIRKMEEEKKSARFSPENFIELSLEKTDPLIVIAIETDFGVKKFALDTGASRTILRTPDELLDAKGQIYTTTHFKIGEHEFGSIPLYLFDISSRFQCDGLLGRDFFRNHAVYLDFENKKGYIEKKKKQICAEAH